MKFKSSYVVVDADVARSAGLAEHPISKSSRNLLRDIAESNLHIAFCPILLAEWKKHKSLMSTRWLSSMIARKKFHCSTPLMQAHIEIKNANLSDKDQAIAQKDAHVVDIAISTGNFIASNDKIARGVFISVANNTNLLDRLMWIVPTEINDQLIDILKNGGVVPAAWILRTN